MRRRGRPAVAHSLAVEQVWSAHHIAHEVKTAQDLSRQIQPITVRMGGFDEAAAYEVAHLIYRGRISEGARPVGRKLGFTNREIWPVYAVYAPIWAHVYDTTVVHLSGSRGSCRLGRFVEPRIEPEIVLHFRSAPPPSNDPAEILACVDWIAHGFEIVQSHFPGWKFQAADTIADSALHGTLLVGAPQDVARLGPDLVARLEHFTVALACDGIVRDRGCGSNVLGSPLAAVAHLISLLATHPRATALQAGELVTTGTLTQALPIRASETWSTALDGIGLPGLSVTLDA